MEKIIIQMEEEDIQKAIKKFNNICISHGNKILEIKRNDINKGTIVHHILLEKNPMFALSIGDDIADEEMHKVLNTRKNTMTIKVGFNKNTIAKHQIQDYKEAIKIIEKFSKYKYKNIFMDVL